MIATGIAVAAALLLTRKAGAEPPPPPPPIDHIPYPEEARDLSQTMTNMDVEAMRDAWITKYKVPVANQAYWHTAQLILDNTIPYPAGTVSQTMQVWIRPEWCNPGVIAHEFAHIEYWWAPNKNDFAPAFHSILATDPVLIMLHNYKPALDTNDIEAYAEIYRYLNEYMPASLKQFYPTLV